MSLVVIHTNSVDNRGTVFGHVWACLGMFELHLIAQLYVRGRNDPCEEKASIPRTEKKHDPAPISSYARGSAI